MDRAHIIQDLASRFGISPAEAADAFEEAGFDEFAAAELLGCYHYRYGGSTGFSTNRSPYLSERRQGNDPETFAEFLRSVFAQISLGFRALFRTSVIIAKKDGPDEIRFPLILAVLAVILAAPVCIIVVIALLMSGKDILTEDDR